MRTSSLFALLLILFTASISIAQNQRSIDTVLYQTLTQRVESLDTAGFDSLTLAILSETSNPYDRLNITNIRAYYFSIKGDQDTTIDLLKTLLDSSRYHKDSVMVLVTLNNLSSMLGGLGQYNVAMAYLIESLEYLKDDSKDEHRSYTYMQIGHILTELHNLDEAKEYLDKAHKIYLELDDSTNIGSYYHAYGEILHEQDSVDMAIAFYNQAGDIFRALDDSNGLGINHFQFGQLFFDQGNLERASRYLIRAFDYLEDIPSNHQKLAKAYHTFASIRFKQGIFSEARDLAATSLEFAILAQDNEEIVKSYELLSDINYKDERYEEAFHYQKLAKKAFQEISAVRIDAETERVKHQDLLNQKELEAAHAEDISKLQDDKKKSGRSMLLTIIGSSALTLLMALLYAKKYFDHAKIKREFEKQGKLLNRLETDLIEAERNIQELSAERSSFGRMMKAELLAPLEAIQLTGDHMLSQSNDSESRIRIQSIMLHAANLKTLFAEAFEYSKVVHDKVDLNFDAFDFNQFLQDLESAAADWNWRSDNSFELIKPNEAPKAIFSDRKALFLILKNLLNNAFQHNRNCNVKLNIQYSQVESTLNGHKLNMQFEIIDDGEGMSKETLDQIREAFHSQRLTLMPQVTGSGLGISVTARLIKAFGGEATIASAKRGTRVTLTLPLKVKF